MSSRKKEFYVFPGKYGHGQEQELNKGIKLPALKPWNSKCDDTSTKDGFDTVEMQSGIQATSKVDAFPNISSSDRPIVKKVAFEDGIWRQTDTKKKKKQFKVTKYPRIGVKYVFRKGTI